MDNDITAILDEAIKIELNISDLYHIFSEKFSADKDFWWQLVMEEKNHASLLLTGKEFLKFKRFPKKLLPDSLAELKEVNKMILEIQQKFMTDPDRIRAFEAAFQLENSTGEVHYQNYMRVELGDELQDIFRNLNRADIDHAERIKRYWDNIK